MKYTFQNIKDNICLTTVLMVTFIRLLGAHALWRRKHVTLAVKNMLPNLSCLQMKYTVSSMQYT